MEANILKANTTFRLMDLPVEIRQMIFEDVIAVPEPITPLQIKRRSNKFFWSTDQLLNRQSWGWCSILRETSKARSSAGHSLPLFNYPKCLELSMQRLLKLTYSTKSISLSS